MTRGECISDDGSDIEHRREDGEIVGWIRPAGDDFVAVDVLGRPVTGPVDWLAAEESLEATGIGFLAEPWTLEREDGRPLRVRMVEVSRDGIRVKKDDWGAIDAPRVEYRLPWPIPDALRPWRREDGVGDGIEY